MLLEEALTDLSNSIGEKIQSKSSLTSERLGYQTEGNEIIGLKINKKALWDIHETVFKLISLKFLDLNFNKIDALPSQLSILSNLLQLNIADNELSKISDETCTLEKLEQLNLERNLLRSLPEEIQNLSKLKGLYLAGNQLESIPESIGELTELEGLCLKDNRLTTVPESITKLRKLKRLDFSGNPGIDTIMKNKGIFSFKQRIWIDILKSQGCTVIF